VRKLLARGFKVFVIDYPGNIDGTQAYVNNIEAGHSMLDAARAALALNYTTPETPIGFYGYSQGGGASALGTTLQKPMLRTSTWLLPTLVARPWIFPK